MVWLLVPNHPSLGLAKYYLTSEGTYKIGRKDCAIIIQTDRTVSRLHAEIIISLVKDGNDSSDSRKTCRPRIVLKDVSKFGSFVNRSAGSSPVFSLPNKEKELNEGDIVTFGTDNSSFRLEYFTFHPHIPALADESKRHAIVSLIASAGGCIIDVWCSDCSHLIVEDGSDVTYTVLQAVADKKPVIGLAWIETLSARSSLSSEFASCSRFTPNLQWTIDSDAKFLKIIEPEARSVAFTDFTFYIGSTYLYKYKDLLQHLIGASGGSVRLVTKVAKSRQVPGNPQQKCNEIIILPDLEPKLERWLSPEEVRSISHMRRTSEDKFIAAVLTGEFQEEYYETPASPAASVSSDETMEGSNSVDHQDEISSANQGGKEPLFVGKAGMTTVDANRPISTEKTPQRRATRSQQRQDDVVVSFLQSSTKRTHRPNLVSEKTPVSMEDFKGVQKPSTSAAADVCSGGLSSRVVVEESGEGTAAIEFRSDCIVHKDVQSLEKENASDLSVINFKRFKKKLDSSGNSFATLIPFAKQPYREADFNKELQEYVQQEKKRKQAEAMAEELFNAEQLKRKKGMGASLVTALREGRIKINS